MSAYAIIDLKHSEGNNYTSVSARCSACSYITYTAGPSGRDFSNIIDEHLKQHNPGRAPDIEIEYILSADCSVCEDGGDIVADDGVLLCRICQTSWSDDGTHGFLSDE